MTINATAMWLLALYQAVAEEHGHDVSKLAGTTQNDIIKEYLSRGTYVFPPAPSMRLITDMVAYTVTTMPKWNPINICSYHLQEAGATPEQEIAYAHHHRDRRPRLGARLRPGAAGEVRRGRRPHLLLRQRGRPLRRGDVQDARLHPALGRADEGALRRRGPQAPPVPLRRAGQLPGPDRGAAGEQRAADRAGDARGHAVPRRPRPRRAAAGLERGARPAAALGPAVVAAAAAGARLRDRPARVRGPVHRLGRRREEGRRARSRAPGPRWPASRSWAAPSRRSSPAT